MVHHTIKYTLKKYFHTSEKVDFIIPLPPHHSVNFLHKFREVQPKRSLIVEVTHSTELSLGCVVMTPVESVGSTDASLHVEYVVSEGI